MNRKFAVFIAFVLGVGAARAQLALPGAALSDPAPAADAPAKPKPHVRRPAAAPARLAAEPAVGQPLRLNGRSGELRLERGADKTLRIVRYALLGEVISNPAQECRIDIVADAPIEAKSVGEPEGLPRYSADIAACPLSFDLVGDGVLAPTQSNACVFAAADCQANPGGLWGPEPAALDAKTVSKARAAADRAIQDSLRDLARRDKDAAAELSKDSSDFAARRDDVCQNYAGEARLGFCASRLAQARAAQLAKRLAASGPVSDAAPRKRRRPKPQ